MSARHEWNEHYASGFLPWDTGVPDPALVAWIEDVPATGPAPARVVEIGCGTGTNAVWLATQGYDVIAIDIAPLAIERARARAVEAGVSIELRALDFLEEELGIPPVDLVFDRGCFHVFDAPADQARFAARVAGLLVPGGTWLTLTGSTEGPPRDSGPPRRSARDLANAIEPHLEIVSLRRVLELGVAEAVVAGWSCLSRRRTVEAQPSTSRRSSE